MQHSYSDVRESSYKQKPDIKVDQDVEAIINQIVNILTIPPYSIPGRPEFASSLYNYLHEPDDITTHAAMQTVIEQLLKKYVDRITVKDVVVVSFESQVVEIDITFMFRQDEIYRRLRLEL